MLKNLFGRKKTIEAPAEKAEPSRFEGVVKDDDQFYEDTVKFLAALCGVLAKSYGPLGSNTLIERLGSTPTVTKDGYTILENLRFANSQDKALHDLIKRVSYNLVKTVGDGSTSAVLSASFMYEYLAPLRNTGMCSRKQLIDILDRIVEYLVEDLESDARKIDGNNKQRVLTAIASISNNNDLKIGDYIAGLFQKLNFLSDVRIEEDPRDSNVPLTHSIRYGFTFDRGPIHNLYFNQVGRSTLAVKEPLVYMSYEFFPPHYENLKEIQKANPDRPIVAVVEQTHEDTVNECLSDFLKGNNKIFLIRAGDMSLEAYHDEFLDAAIYLDSDIIRDPKTFKMEQLGACKSVEFYGTKTVFMSGDGMARCTEFYNERIQQLEKEYDETPNNLPSKRGAIRLRLSKLSGVSVKILVGGITEEEKKARRFLVEDAVLACKSALAKGYGFGGNVNLYFSMTRLCDRFDSIWEGDHTLKQFEKEFVRAIFLQLRRVYFDTYFCIMTKSPEYDRRGESMREEIAEETSRIFNVLTNKFESIDETTVLAPIDTDIQILKASVSIMGMLISINQFVSC